MAANAAAMRNALVRIGFSNQGAVAVVDVHGYDEIEELSHADAKNLCHVIRKPGGMIPGDNGENVPNPGVFISARAEESLKLAIYFIKHRKRTSRVTNPADITLQNIRSLKELMDDEEQHEEPDPPTDLFTNKDWTRIIEILVEYLREKRGNTSKLPLVYVVRKEEAVQDDPEGGWPTKIDEMINRAPILDDNGPGGYNVTYLADREAVWHIIAGLTRNHSCWTYVKVAQRTRDGRLAYQALYNHYLGPNNVDNLANDAERKLQTTTYTGEKRNWNFEKYVTAHVEQFNVLENLKQYGHTGIDPRSRVRHLLDGIKTRDLDSVKTLIMADHELKSNFDRCVTLYKDYITGMKTSNEPRQLNVSEMGARPYNKNRQGGGGKLKEEDLKDIRVEDRYYTAQEYRKLTPKQKSKLRLLRDKRGGGVNGKRGAPGSNVKLSKSSIQELATAVSQVRFEDEREEGSDTSETNNDKSNRNHPALTRQKVKKSKKD